MMRWILLTVCGLMVSMEAVAQLSFSSSFTVLRVAAGGPVFYDLNSDTSNPNFTNTVTTLYEGENLLLGGEASTPHYSCNSQEAWIDQVTMYYSIDGGVTNSLPLPLLSFGSPDKWQQASTTGMAEIAHSLGTGVHTIAVYFVGVDVNFCVGGGASTRLPATGAYAASFEIVANPRKVIAADDAAQRGYLGGWTNQSLGGCGFGAWTNMTLTGDGAAGFFLNSAITGAVASRAKAWGMYANEGGSGGDQIQIAAAFRTLDTPLQVGQTLVIDFQHGGVQSGSLSENQPPRTGGWVGFALRENMPTQFGDPDPFSAFGTFQNAMVAVGFKGGDTEYRAYDLNNTLGYYTGLGFTTSGVRVELTFTTTNNFTIKLSDLGTGSNATVFGVTVGGPPDVLAIYNRNAEEADAYFNNIYILDGVDASRAADDNAADTSYLAGWTNNVNGGFGFQPWLLGIVTNAGSAGTFIATNPPNTDLNAIASAGRAWGAYANDTPGGGVQAVTAYRYFGQTNMQAGQAFGVAIEHGGISAINGQLELMMLGLTRFGNEQGEVMRFAFVGGGTSYQMFDDLGSFYTSIPWSDGGLRFHLDILKTSPVVFYALTVDTRGQGGGIYRICGEVESIPKAVRLKIIDVELADVFFNYLYLTGIGALPDVIIQSIIQGTGIGIGIDSLSGWFYSLEKRTNIIDGNWSSVPSQTNIPGTGGLLILTNDSASTEAYYRINAQP